MAEISKPTFGTAIMPFPSEAIITPMWTSSEVVTLGGKSRRDVMARKYQYTLKWDYMGVRDYDILETVVNTLIANTFIYGKWPQCVTPGITCLGSLSARKLEVGVGSVNYWSSVTLTLTEVDSRI